MKSLILILFFVLFGASSSFATDLFWIGGTGNWSDPNHWSTTSGGGACACTPGIGDNAFFDANSGLASIADVVTFDFAFTINDLDFSAVPNPFTISSVLAQVELNGSLTANGSAVILWPNGEILMNPIVPVMITSNGMLWDVDFRITGDSTTLVDNFNLGLNDLSVDEGYFKAQGVTMDIDNFYSNTALPRNLFVNCTTNLSGTIWDIQTTSLTLTVSPGIVNLNNPTTVIFNGGNGNYTDVHSSASVLEISGDHSFQLLELAPSSTLKLNDGSYQYCTSLLSSGTCGMPTTIKTINDLTNASFDYTGVGNFTASNLVIDMVNAIAPDIYDLTFSDTINGSLGWNSFSTDFYWIGGTGDWSDPAHWSFTSGGLTCGCTPGVPDNVIFDDLSGLPTITDTVTMDIPVVIHNYDFSAVSNPFTIASLLASIEIQGSLSANGLANIAWNGAVNFNPYVPELLTSNSQVWNNDFVKLGTSSISIADNLNTSGDLYADNGDLTCNDTITCANFYSTLATVRSIDFNNIYINLQDSIWNINPTGLTWTALNSTINLNKLDPVYFTGGSLTYDTIRVNTNELEVYGNNTISLFYFASNSNLTLDNGSLQNVDSVVTNGSCGTPTRIHSLNLAMASAQLNKTGTPSLYLNSVELNNVDANAPGIYSLQVSDTMNGADGWEYIGTNYFWIGDGGSWSDGNHWSFNSGGTPAGCFPGIPDSVIFDNLSFTLPGEIVLIDSMAVFSSMDWSTVTFPETLDLDTVIQSYGDITFYPDLFVTRDSMQHMIRFVEQADFSPDSALVDCTIGLFMNSATDSLSIFSDLIMTDTSSIFLFNGRTYTQGNYIRTGSLLSIDDGASVLDARLLDLGSSTIDLIRTFNSAGDLAFTFNGGTSHITISDTSSYQNSLETEGIVFYDVTLEFEPLTTNFPVPGTVLMQKVTGNNTFNKFEILKGSAVYFQAGQTQIVNDSLLMIGTCRDSIFISSTDTASYTAANINKAIVTDASVQCVDISGITNSTGNVTALFSSNTINNSNWTFSTAKSITAGFTALGSYCFGDTTLFADNTVTFPGVNNYTTQWYYNDTTTGYFIYNSPTDSVWINYEIDTLQHQFAIAGDITVQMIAINENFCTDTSSQVIHINNPIVALIPSESDLFLCAGDSIAFSAVGLSPNMDFEFFFNGVSQNIPSPNDTLYTSTTLITGDQVGVLGYENGCVTDDTTIFQYTVTPLPSYSWTYSSGLTVCEGDSVAFNVSPTNPLQTLTYQFTINGSSVAYTPVGFYWTDTLNNNDIVSVIVKDSLSCSESSSYIFTVNSLPTTSLVSSVGGGVICDGEQVTFTAIGAATYEFFIDGLSQGLPGGSTFVTTSLTSGDTVSVIGYTALGCGLEAPEFYSYAVNPLPLMNMSVSDADTLICSGESVTFNASGASLYEFFINGISQGAPSPTSTFNSLTLSNNDTVYVQGEFSGCVASSDSAFFEVLISPTTTLVADLGPTICQEDGVTFTSTGATSYEFFIDGISQGPASAIDTFFTSELFNGNTVTVAGESNTCIVEQNLNFSVLSIPSVGLFSDDPDNMLCDGEPLTLTAANASSYDLYIDGVLSISQLSPIFINPVLPVDTSEVYVIGTAANGCADTSQTILTIQINPIPNIVLTSSDADDIICSGESVTLTGVGSNNYQFFVDGSPLGSMSPTSTLTTTNLLDGQVIQITGSSLGCTSNSNSIAMTVNPIPAIVLTSTDVNNVFCADQSVDFTGSGANNYQFIVNGVSQGPSSPVNMINSLGFASGSYSVQVIGETNNCFSTATNMITVNAVPNAVLTSSDANNIICTNESVTYTGAGGSLYEFFINGVSQGGASPLTSFTTTLVNGDVVSVDVSSTQGCVSSDVMPAITVNTSPTVTLASSDIDFIICQGDNVIFTAAGGTVYEFFVNGVSQGAPSPVPTFTTSGLNNGDNVDVTGSSIGCDASYGGITFTVYGAPVVSLTNIGDNNLCVGELTNLIAAGASNYQYYVNASPVGGLTPITSFNNALNNGDIVTVEGETNGCFSFSANSESYIVYNYPTITSTASATTICVDDLVNFTAFGAMTYDFDLNGTIVQSGSTSTFDLSTLLNGDVITITGYNGDCASSSDVYNFTVNSMNLDLIVAASSMICEGENAVFTATGADEYEFFLNGVSQGTMSAANTFSSSLLIDLDEITFTGYSNSTLCTQVYNDYILMNVISEPLITPQSSITFCEGDSVVLLSNLNYGNQWYVDGTLILGATDTSYTAFASGSYSLDIISGGLGDVWSFGQNASGTFGNGNNFNNADPTIDASSEQFTQLSSGFDFILGVTINSELYAWGENSSGQLGNGTYTSTNTPQIVPTLANIKNIATTESSSMAVTTAGDVYVWGNNAQGQLATGNTSVINFPFLNAALANTDSIAGGRTHFVILKNDGTVWTVGNNSAGQLGQGNLTSSFSAIQVPGLANIVSVGAGEYHSFAINNNGDLFVWGKNGTGQLGLGDLTNRLNPTLSPLKNIINAQGGANHSAFLSSNETVYTSGGNAFGQLGTGNFTNSTVPVQTALSGVDMISTGQYTTLVKRKDMSIFGFGNNTEEQLSSLNGSAMSTPEHIFDLDGVTFIEASKSSSHFIYNEDQVCTSQVVIVDAMTVPQSTITASGDTLSTEPATSYQWYFNGNPIPNSNSQAFIANTSGNYEVEVVYANGCSSVSDVYYHSMVSIKDLSLGNVNVYPNPTNDIINIQLSQELVEPTNVVITDQFGRIVKEASFNSGALLSINVSELENGIYHILVQNSIVSGNIRFVKSPK